MRANLKFDFDIEGEEERFEIALNGSKFKLVLRDLDDALRGWGKYGYEFKTIEELIIEARRLIADRCAEYHITLCDWS